MSSTARLVRGLLAAMFTTLVAALSHAAAGGMLPHLLPLTASLASASLICVLLANRRMDTVRLSLAVGLSQLSFHCLFSVLEIQPPAAVAGGGHHGAGALGATMHATSAEVGGVPHHEPWMTLTHACAALLTFFAVRHGETTLWRLVDVLEAEIREFLLPKASQPAPLPTAARAAFEFLRDQGLRDLGVHLLQLRYRGPPLRNSL